MFTKNTKSSPIDSLIGAGSRIEGNIEFTGGLRVDGEIFGNIEARGERPGTLVISDQARIEGQIRVGHVVINGEVVGPVLANDHVELMPKARVTGDVYYRNLEIHVGAVVTGRLMHMDEMRSDKVVELKLSATTSVEGVGAVRPVLK